jgi:hypothetical protein
MAAPTMLQNVKKALANPEPSTHGTSCRFAAMLRRLQMFLSGYGYSRRVFGMPVDGHGRLVPWPTYPMIEFLNGLDFAQATVFEFGAGGSTLYPVPENRFVRGGGDSTKRVLRCSASH